MSVKFWHRLLRHIFNNAFWWYSREHLLHDLTLNLLSIVIFLLPIQMYARKSLVAESKNDNDHPYDNSYTEMKIFWANAKREPQNCMVAGKICHERIASRWLSILWKTISFQLNISLVNTRCNLTAIILSSSFIVLFLSVLRSSSTSVFSNRP